jgi:hypothetical protein
MNHRIVTVQEKELFVCKTFLDERSLADLTRTQHNDGFAFVEGG